MKRIIIVFVLMTSAFVPLLKAQTPEVVAEKFLNYTNKREFDKAKEYSTEKTAAFITLMMGTIPQMDSVEQPESKIENIKCIINEDETTCTCTCINNGGEQTLYLVKEKRKWKVDLKVEYEVGENDVEETNSEEISDEVLLQAYMDSVAVATSINGHKEQINDSTTCWYYYYPSGKVKEKYINNNAIYRYYENGKLSGKDTLGEVVGTVATLKSVQYDSLGNLLSISTFEWNNELGTGAWAIVTTTEYYPKRAIKLRKKIVDAEEAGVNCPCGTWEYFDEKGKQTKKEVYPNCDKELISNGCN